MDNPEDTKNSPQTLTSSVITIRSTEGSRSCNDDPPLKTDTETMNKVMCDDHEKKDNGDMPVSDDRTQLLISTSSVPNSEPNNTDESATVRQPIKIERKDVIEAAKDFEVLERTAIEHVDPVDINSVADTINRKRSSSPTNINASDVVSDTAVVNKNRDRDALTVIVGNDELVSKSNKGIQESRISGRTVEKSKHTSTRKHKRVTGDDGKTHRNLKNSSTHLGNRSIEGEKSNVDSDLTFNSSETFGESHVNKLMSFVDSLEKIDPPLTKACGLMPFSHLDTTSPVKEFSHISSVKTRYPGDDLFKPYTTSPSSVANRNMSSMYVPKSAAHVEQPLDLSLTRHRSSGNDYLSKPSRGSPSFSKGLSSAISTDHMMSKFGDTPSTFGPRSNSHDLSPNVKRPWVPASGSPSTGINWSLAASSLSSLQAQMEAVILSYPLFKASIELCKNLIPPAESENEHVEEIAKMNIKTEKRDNKVDYSLPFKRQNEVEESSPELRSLKNNLKDSNSKASLHSSYSTLKPNHSQHASKKKPKLSLPSDRHSKASMEWRSNQGSLKGKSIAMQEDSFKKSRMEEGTMQNSKMTTSLDIGTDVMDDRRLLTSLSCSCQRQFATLYQLTIHLEETGHHPLQVKTDSADDFAKLVRGQDLWLSAGHAQAEQTLRCMHCHASFHSLPELTVHMVKTKHYVDIVGREESETNRQLITKEVFQKIQETLHEQERYSANKSKEPHICKQCRTEFHSEDELSDHLFETGHQMLAEENVPIALSEHIPRESQDDNVINDVKDNCFPERQSCTAVSPLKQNGDEELSTQIESIVCAQIKREEDLNCAESSTAFTDYKLLVDRDVKPQFEKKIDPENEGLKKSSDNSNKRHEFSKVYENDRSIVNGKRKREQCIQQSSTSIYKRKPVTNKMRKSPDLSLSWHDKAAKPRLESISPSRSVESRSFNENIMNQTDPSKTSGDVSRKGFMELISPMIDIGDSSSTLKAMESFVERSFSSSNLISPVSQFSVSQAGKQSSLNAASYSNAIRLATSSASKYHVGFNWNDRNSTITPNKVHLKNRKNRTLGCESSSDSCHSPPLKLGSNKELETSIKNDQSDFQITKTRRDTKRKRTDSFCDIEVCNSRFNSSSSVKTQPKEYNFKESTEVIKPLLNIETGDTSSKVKAGSHDSHETASPTNATSSYASSTLDYLQHFVDDRALQLIPPQTGTGKSLQDAGRKLSIKT